MLARFRKLVPLEAVFAFGCMVSMIVLVVHAGPPVMPGEEDPAIEVRFAPGSDPAKFLMAKIGKARFSIDCMAYHFTDEDVAAALTAAVKRGCLVRVIVDGHVAEHDNPALNALRAGGVNLRMDYKHPIHHNKVLVIDRATVVTGSYNFTKAAQENAENCLAVRDGNLAAKYRDAFKEHWDHAGNPNP